MDKDFDSIFSHDQTAENQTEVTADTTTELTQEVVEEVVEAPVVEEAAQAAPAPQEHQRHPIPVEALIEERTKRQEAEKRIAEYEQRERENAARKTAENRPDPFEAPDEYDAYVQTRISAAIESHEIRRQEQALLASFHDSHSRAVEKHGAETVQKAMAWAEQRAATDEAWAARGLAQSDQVEWLLKEQNRHALIEQISSAESEEAFIARRAAELGLLGTASAAPANNMNLGEKVQAPRSIANVGSSNTVPTAQTKSDAFNSIFDSKR